MTVYGGLEEEGLFAASSTSDSVQCSAGMDGSYLIWHMHGSKSKSFSTHEAKSRTKLRHHGALGPAFPTAGGRLSDTAPELD